MQALPCKLYLAEQSRELDRIAIEEYGIPGIKLMQRAATAVFNCILQRENIKHITIFCGAGNNAGDGYLVGSLALQANFNVSVYAVAPPEKLTGDALTAYQDYIQHGGHILTLQTPTHASDLIVDALLGTGLTREVSGIYADAVALINQAPCPVVAVDIPSGINANTGCVMGCAVKADTTVSFIALKQGLFTADACDYCGEIVFDDLKVPDEVFEQLTHNSERLLPSKLPRRQRNTHKGDFGHLLVAGGDTGFSGAARMTAEAALRSGAGLVSVATHPTHAHLLNQGRFELMCHAIEQSQQLKPLQEKANVIVLGPGLGQSLWSKSLFNELHKSSLAIVMDADGLNLLAQSPDYNDNRILTPHPKEAARLLACTTKEIINDRFWAVKAIQRQYGGICILKGAGTLIYDGNQLFINSTGNPGMATAGMGDVLSGIIGGLLVQGFSLISAATKAVYIHGTAADLAAKQGERGLLACDLMPYIRKLVN